METGSVVITGCSGGIGVALTQAFHTEGYYVIGIDRNSPSKDACIDHYMPFDLENIQDEKIHIELQEEILSACKYPLRCLINNAACQVVSDSQQLSLSDWRQTLVVNLLAPFVLTQILASGLQKSNGSVINMASIHSQLTKPGFVAYATSKSALSGLTKAMAVELGSKIRINAIAPAATDTPMLRSGFTDFETQYEALSLAHPVGRIGSVKEVAEVALFLASSRASYINGATIPVDGGISARLHDPI